MDTAASRPVDATGKLASASIGGAIGAAFAASLCCLGPLVLAALGLGGAGLLVELETYRPHFAALTLALLAAGFYLTYRRRRAMAPVTATGPACDCALPRASRFGRVALWVATVVVVFLLAFPYLAGILFD